MACNLSAIPLSQTLGPAEAVSRTIAHAELFEAEPAPWRIIDEPKLSASGSALRAAKIRPRATVRERRMSDADELGLFAEWYAGPLVLKPDRTGSPQARYAEANKLVEEDATVGVASAFRHALKVTPSIGAASLYHRLSGDGFPVGRLD
jgi:hypothetical protein